MTQYDEAEEADVAVLRSLCVFCEPRETNDGYGYKGCAFSKWIYVDGCLVQRMELLYVMRVCMCMCVYLRTLFCIPQRIVNPLCELTGG